MATVVLNSDVRQHKRRPRINKHLTERRRRARINDSLFQLKNLVFPALENKLSQNSKVEKADILEMTLQYLRGLQKQASKTTTQGPQEPSVNHFQAGFSECLGEVTHFLLSCDTVDRSTRMQLLNHLTSRSPLPMHSPPSSSRYPPSFSPPSALSNGQASSDFSKASNRNLSVDVRSTTVQASWNGSPFSLMTPPSSPMDAEELPYSRVHKNSEVHYQSERKINSGLSQISPMWRPWLK